LLIAFLVIWFVFIDVFSLTTRWKLTHRKKELIEKTQDLHVKSEELKIKLALFENNQILLEKIAREKYGMRKYGEKIYKLEVK
jgi:cell division protein FtsB